MKDKLLYGFFIFLLIGILILIFGKMNKIINSINTKPVSEIASAPTLIKLSDINTGIGGNDKYLSMVKGGEEIIRFSFSDKRIIGIDGRTIGYLNDEEVKLLQNFLGGER